MRPWERNAANLARSLAFYGTSETRGGVTLITSRVAYSVFNIALLAEPVSDVAGELERRIVLAQAFYASQRRPWSFWFCEHMLGALPVRRLDRVCERYGLHPLAESPGLEAPELPAPRRRLPQVEFRRVDDAATRAAFADIVAQCFHIPQPIARLVYEYEPAWRTQLRVWLAYEGGCAVASTAALAAAGGRGLYSVATLPGLRGRGLAEATMRHALDDLRATGAAGPVVLQSSPAGLELYRRLGFQKVTRYFIFATP